MPVHKLILLPANPHATISDCSTLATCLHEIGLIGKPVVCEQGAFYPAGDNFLQLVSFLGCSPSIELEPPADAMQLADAIENGNFCHVILSCPGTMQFRTDPQSRPPRCPQCSQPVADPETCIRRWQDNPAETRWLCTACGYHGKLTDWLLRKDAGFGKVFLEIRGIYPSEAVPGEPLLRALQSLTDGHWQYIYIKE